VLSIIIIGGMFSWALNLFIGCYVFSNNPRNVVYQKFFLFSLSIAFWSVGSFLVQFIPGDAILAVTRLCYVSACFLPVLSMDFGISLVDARKFLPRLFYLLPIVFMILLFFGDFFIRGLRQIPNQRFYVTDPGSAYGLFFVYFVIGSLATLMILFRGAQHNFGLKKKQLQYAFVAYLIAAVAGLDYFLSVFKIVDCPPIDDYLLVLTFAILAYAIIRHRLMDIDVIIKKTIVFGGIVLTVVSSLAVLLGLVQALIGISLGSLNPLILMIIGIITTVSIYRPMEKWLVMITDRYLFQKKINYRVLLREASAALAHVDSLKSQARTMVAFLIIKARITHAAVYAFAAPDRSCLTLKASRPQVLDPLLRRIGLEHPLIDFFQAHQEPIEIHALEEAKGRGEVAEEAFKAIASLMESLKAEAAIPCYGGEAASRFNPKAFRLKGILFLGPQKSDESYREEELDVFFTLGQESSIAFENARLYDEAVNRALELERINEELKRTHSALLEEKKRAVLAAIGKSMAHEIRNPITPMNSHLYFGRKRLEEMRKIYEATAPEAAGEDREKFLKNFNSVSEAFCEIEKCKDRIQGIVNTLYNLVAQKTGNKVEVKLDMVVDSAIEEVKYQNYWETLNQPVIENLIPRDLPFVSGIPQDLQGVFVNLIVNAIHAMEKTTKKVITIDAITDDESPNMVRVEFSDNGCGMSPEVQAKLFEHGFTTKGARGTGLGLFYCRNIIEKVHGGTISVTSRPGEGTCFTICLPEYRKMVESAVV
jgi:signal transduction histidine kinase